MREHNSMFRKKIKGGRWADPTRKGEVEVVVFKPIQLPDAADLPNLNYEIKWKNGKVTKFDGEFLAKALSVGIPQLLRDSEIVEAALNARIAEMAASGQVVVAAGSVSAAKTTQISGVEI